MKYEQQEETTKLPDIGGLVSRYVECSGNKVCKCHAGKLHGPYWYVGFYKHANERYWYYIGKTIEGVEYEDWPVEYQGRYERAVEDYKRKRGLSYTTTPAYNKNKNETEARIHELESKLQLAQNKVAILEEHAFMQQNFIEANESIGGPEAQVQVQVQVDTQEEGIEEGTFEVCEVRLYLEYKALGFNKKKMSECMYRVYGDYFVSLHPEYAALPITQLKRKMTDHRSIRDPIYDCLTRIREDPSYREHLESRIPSDS